MEDGDISLEKEIEELTLDRPPGSVLGFGGTESVVEDILKDVPKDVPKEENECETIISSRLATCLIDKPLSCQAQDQDVTFDPLSSSEKNFYTNTENIEIIKDDVPEFAPTHGLEEPYNVNEINILHSSDVEQIHVLSSSILQVVQSSESKTTETKTCTVKSTSSKEKLVSCLKGDQDENTSNATDTDDKVCTRCVRFTDGPGIVTEFIEPVNPWRDMRTPSKGEVVSLYKNVCKKMKCKPLDKVVKQIQEAPDLSARSGTLVLRGCRLDNKSCEALESVFKRVQFENLDLENCSLEEDGATAILEMIEFYHSTCKLNIACNPKVGLRGWQALCRMLRKTPCLTYLDARRTILTEMTMPTFGRCLKADPYLKVLHLEGVFLSGRPLLILTTALKYNRLLEELYLGDNDLTSNDGPSLGAMLTYNTTLQLLDLRNNQIKDIGLAHIGNGLSDQTEQPCGGLCSLIMWNNGLTHEGMSYLCEGLVKTTTLKALNLGQNRISDLGVQKLKGGLIKNKSLRKLGFLNTKLGSEGAVALAEVLADSWSITRIDIRENNIQTAGLMAFAMALKVNQSLLRLDLDKDIRKEPGMETVMQSVLVDIYNLCYRNKNLIRKNMTPTQSLSSCSIGTVVSRQSSTSSEMNEPFSYDDVFHPEAANQEATPFSPTVCVDNPLDANPAGIMFSSLNNITSQKGEIDTPDSTESLGNSISSAFENVKRGRAYSDPVRNNPDPAPNGRRPSRFSVTKILDSLGTHAQGVASKFAQIDNKLKKQQSKEKTDVGKSSELVPVLDQNQPIELDQFKSQPTNEDNTGLNNENANIDTSTPEDPTNTDIISTEDDTNTDTISTESPMNTDTATTDEPLNNDRMSTHDPTDIDAISTDEPVNTDTIISDEPVNTIYNITTDEPSDTNIIITDECVNTINTMTTDTIITDECVLTDKMTEPTDTDKISTEDHKVTDITSTDDCVNTVYLTTDETVNTDTISTDELTSTDKISIDEPTNTDTEGCEDHTNTDTTVTDECVNSGTVTTEKPMNTDTSTDEHASTDKEFTIAGANDNVDIILDSNLEIEGCVQQTDIFDTFANKIEDSNNKNFDREVTSTSLDNNVTDTSLTPKCVDVSASLHVEHSTNENMCAASDISKVFYEEQTIDECLSSPDGCDISQIDTETSKLTYSIVESYDSPDNGSMENLLIDNKSENNGRTIGMFTSCDSDTTTMREDVATTHHCVDETFDDTPFQIGLNEGNENNKNDLPQNHHELAGKDLGNQLTDTNLNENINLCNEPTLLDSVVKIDDCIDIVHDGNIEKDQLHDGNGGNIKCSLDCEDTTENIVSDSTTVAGDSCIIREIDNDGTVASNQCRQGTDDCLLDADGENLVNVKLEITPVISTAINDNIDIKLNDVAFEYDGKSQAHFDALECM